MSLVNKVLADLEARQGLVVNSGSVMAGLSASAEDARTDRPRAPSRLNQWFLIATLAVGAWTLFSERSMRGEEAVATAAIAAPIAQPAMPAVPTAVTASTTDTNAVATPASAGLKLDFSLSPTVADTRIEDEAGEFPLEASPVEAAADTAIEPRELVPSEEPAPIADANPPVSAEASADPAPAAVSISGEMQRKRSGEQIEDGAGALVNEARRLTQTGQIEAANARLGEALKMDPDHVAARSQLAIQWQSQERLAEARALLEEGLQRQPEIVEWNKLVARIMVAQGDEDVAINTLARQPPQVTEDPDYHAFLAALYQRRNRHAEAITAYREVLRYQPGSGVWWMGLAISLEAEERNAESLQAYRQAIQTGRLIAELQDFVEQKITALSQANEQ